MLREAVRIKALDTEEERQAAPPAEAVIVQHSLASQAAKIGHFSFTEEQQTELVRDIVKMVSLSVSQVEKNPNQGVDEEIYQSNARSMLRVAIHEVLSKRTDESVLTKELAAVAENFHFKLQQEKERQQEIKDYKMQATVLSMNIIAEVAQRLTNTVLEKLKITPSRSLVSTLVTQIQERLSTVLLPAQAQRIQFIGQRKQAQKARIKLKAVDETSSAKLQEAKQLLEHAKSLREEAITKEGEIQDLASTTESAGAGANPLQLSFTKYKESKK